MKADPVAIAVILVGSVARGAERPDSDVDVYLVVPDDVFESAVATHRVIFVERIDAQHSGGWIPAEPSCCAVASGKRVLVPGPLVFDLVAVAAVCKRYGVKRLVVFGSAVTDRFDEATSDVDFLVEFGDEEESRFDAYFGLKESLEAMLDRPVDLVSPNALKNPYFAASVEQNAREIYPA